MPKGVNGATFGKVTDWERHMYTVLGSAARYFMNELDFSAWEIYPELREDYDKNKENGR